MPPAQPSQEDRHRDRPPRPRARHRGGAVPRFHLGLRPARARHIAQAGLEEALEALPELRARHGQPQIRLGRGRRHPLPAARRRRPPANRCARGKRHEARGPHRHRHRRRERHRPRHRAGAGEARLQPRPRRPQRGRAWRRPRRWPRRTESRSAATGSTSPTGTRSPPSRKRFSPPTAAPTSCSTMPESRSAAPSSRSPRRISTG